MQNIPDSDFDPACSLVKSVFHHPGYHTRLPTGSRVHETRLSMDYALQCLEAGDAEHIARAKVIIAKICSLQDTEPISPTFGIWSWTFEESLAEMNPPDWNWADFIGARLAVALSKHCHKLDAAVASAARVALSNAVFSIFRRNVSPDYTNIALMGAAVMAAAGRLLDRPEFVRFARARLAAVQKSVASNGSFTEYNSPTYTKVAIDELERLEALSDDAECLARAAELKRHVWDTVLEHWHPATRQWAGPHARAYSDLLEGEIARWAMENVAPQCKADEKPRIIRRAYRRLPSGFEKTATTFFDAGMCLGSFNHEMTWNQMRFLIGYWETGATTAVIKAQILMDGKDFPGMRAWQAQEAATVLSAFQPLYGCGKWHPWFDAPADGIYTACDLRARWSLRAPGCEVKAVGDGFVMAAGDYVATVTPAAVATVAIPSATVATVTVAKSALPASALPFLPAGPAFRPVGCSGPMRLRHCLRLLLFGLLSKIMHGFRLRPFRDGKRIRL